MDFVVVIDPPIGEVVPYKVARRSICPCGHPVIQEFVPDDRVYMIEKWTILPYTMTCGGCKRDHSVKVGIVIEDGKRNGKMVIDGLRELPVQPSTADVA